MAAIVPHLEVPGDATPLERAYDICVGSINGENLGEDLPACPSPNAVLADSHAGLLGMVFVREAVFQSLMTKQFVVRPGNIENKDTRNVYLVLDQPIGPGPAWNPATNPGVQQYQLLSWTSKMNTPSWSIPAGSPQAGGACPGAVAGQTIVPESALRAAARHVNRGLGRSADAPVNLAQCICNFCVTGDTKVLVEGRGWTPIDELVGFKVRVWSGIDWRDTHAVFQGIKPIVQMTTSWGHTIRATPDHKILIVDRGMVPIEELKEGDRLVFQPPQEHKWPSSTPIEANEHMTTQQKYPKVESITWLDKEEAVYDLVNVGEEHQFVANGITVSNCYATGGQYSTGQVQFAQLLRFLWTRQAINFSAPAPDGSMSTAFVETMVYAINSADYKLGGGTVKGEGAEATQELPPEPSGRRFFRIHDSGDFFEEEYLRQWKMIADRLPDITFWAPSRIWATSWGIDAVNRINRDPRNLIIRPSAYEVNEHGPEDLGPGWAGPTTVIAVQQNLGMTPEREQYVYDRAGRFPPKMAGPDPRYTWNCVAAGTLIHVERQGLVNIEDVKIGDRVMTRDGWREVVRAAPRGIKATLVVETSGGHRLRVTPDHRLAGVDDWIEAGELVEGAKLIAMPEDDGASHDAPRSVPAWDRTFNRRGAGSESPAAVFPEQWTRELGIVLGYFAGDAHFRVNGTIEVGVGASKLQDLQKLDDIIKTWIGYGAKFDERLMSANELVDHERVAHRAIWSSAQLTRYLHAFGYGHGVGSSSRRLPIGLLQAPRNAQLGFLAGFLSADGSVKIRQDGDGEICMYTTSPALATELSLLWSTLGARCSTSEVQREPYKTLITILGRSSAALRIARLTNILNDTKRTAASALRIPDRGRVRAVAVRRIVNDGLLVPTWDLEVAGENPEFVAGGLLVHNCQAYATEDQKHTCRKAVAPPGLGGPDGKGCRACWIATDEIVNYSLH